MSSRKEQLHKFIIPRYTVEGFRQKLEPDLCRKFDGLMGSADIQTRTHQRLQDQLADKQEEYDAVCAQERGTLDPTEKIRLQRQMMQLETAIEELERKIKAHQFNIVLDSAESEGWLERLMLCVEPELYYKWILIEIIPNHWEENQFQQLWEQCKESYQSDWQTDRKQELRIQFVDHLWQWESIIARLILKLQDDQTFLDKTRLNKWKKKVCQDPKLPQFQEQLFNTARMREQVITSTPLSIRIEDDPNDPQKIELSIYVWDEQDQPTQLLEKLPTPLPRTLNEVPNYLFRVTAAQVFLNTKLTMVELFLPLRLLTHDIGRWLEEGEFSYIVDKRSVIIRLLERQDNRNAWVREAYPQWGDRWSQLKKNDFHLSNSCVSWFDSYPSDLVCEQRKLRRQEQQNLQTCLAIGFTIGQHIRKKDFFETMILSTGMPVSVWLHTLDHNSQNKLKATLNECREQSLSTKIHDLQREMPLQLGRQVALLWDDPNRMLPQWHSYADDASL